MATTLEYCAEAAFARYAPMVGSIALGLAKSILPPPLVSIKYAPLAMENPILSSSPEAP